MHNTYFKRLLKNKNRKYPAITASRATCLHIIRKWSEPDSRERTHIREEMGEDSTRDFFQAE